MALIALVALVALVTLDALVALVALVALAALAALVLGEVRMNVRVLVLGSTSTHECRSTGTREY